MGHRPAWAPDEIDLERPSAARMYDYYLWRPDPGVTRPDALGGDVTRYSNLAAVGRRT